MQYMNIRTGWLEQVLFIWFQDFNILVLRWGDCKRMWNWRSFNNVHGFALVTVVRKLWVRMLSCKLPLKLMFNAALAVGNDSSCLWQLPVRKMLWPHWQITTLVYINSSFWFKFALANQMTKVLAVYVTKFMLDPKLAILPELTLPLHDVPYFFSNTIAFSYLILIRFVFLDCVIYIAVLRIQWPWPEN